MNYYLKCIFTALALNSLSAYAEDEHQHKNHKENETTHSDEHDHEEESKDHKEKDSHDEDKDHGDDHGHEEEANASIGPGKAIEEANPDKGFRLSSKALKTIAPKILKITSVERTNLPKSAIVTFGADRGIYRVRDGFIKLVDIKIIEKKASEWIIHSKDLRSGDEVVVQGTGLLRVAELEASGGGADGHDH